MCLRDADSEGPRPDPEMKGCDELHRFAVDAGRDRMIGIDLELGRGPLAPRSLRQPAAAAPAGRGTDDGDAEKTVVDSRTGSRADRPAEPIAVVGDEDRRTRLVLVTAGPAPAQIEADPRRPEHLGHGVDQRPELRLAVSLALNGFGIEPK